jgi:hypothetical protein
VQQTSIVEDQDMQRTLQQAADQLEIYLTTFRNVAAWRRRLRNGMFLLIRNRTTRHIVGITRIDIVADTFTIHHTMAHVDQIIGTRKIPGLGAFIKYLVIKKLKQSSEEIELVSRGEGYTTLVSQILIESTAVTKPSASINKELGFVTRRFRM